MVRIPYDPDSVLRRAVLIDDGRPSLRTGDARVRPDSSPRPAVNLEHSTLFRYNGEPRRGVLTVVVLPGAGRLKIAATRFLQEQARARRPLASRHDHRRPRGLLHHPRGRADGWRRGARDDRRCSRAAPVYHRSLLQRLGGDSRLCACIARRREWRHVLRRTGAAPAIAAGAVACSSLGAYVALLRGMQRARGGAVAAIAAAYVLTAAYRFGARDP